MLPARTFLLNRFALLSLSSRRDWPLPQPRLRSGRQDPGVGVQGLGPHQEESQVCRRRGGAGVPQRYSQRGPPRGQPPLRRGERRCPRGSQGGLEWPEGRNRVVHLCCNITYTLFMKLHNHFGFVSWHRQVAIGLRLNQDITPSNYCWSNKLPQKSSDITSTNLKATFLALLEDLSCCCI